MTRFPLSLLAGLWLALVSLAADPQTTPYAVVRIPSHGASATVIHTENGRSLILGCAHAYEGSSRNKKHALDVHRPDGQQPAQNAAIKLLAVDYKADLSLVELADGPLTYVAPVAAAGHRPARQAISAGFDNMKTPITIRTATILTTTGGTTYTRERPWHGRSGGALLDGQTGELIGVVQGYEVDGPGMYVSHATVLAFLSRASLPERAPRQPQLQLAPEPQTVPRSGAVPIPPECWVFNVMGGQCAWASLETLARYHKIERLYGLTMDHKGLTGPGAPESVLKAKQVQHRSQPAGNRDTKILADAVSQGLGCMIGLGGKHCVVLVGLDGQTMTVIDNSSRGTQTRQLSLSAWDGWTIVLYPDSAKPVPQAIRPQPSRPVPVAPCPGGA